MYELYTHTQNISPLINLADIRSYECHYLTKAHSPVPMPCLLYGMRLASLLHRMPRICSLSWLWRPVVARQGAFSTLCSIFSQWYHLLFILSSFQSASSVCRMTRCLGKYVCAWALRAQSMCVWRGEWGVVGCCEPLSMCFSSPTETTTSVKVHTGTRSASTFLHCCFFFTGFQNQLFELFSLRMWF